MGAWNLPLCMARGCMDPVSCSAVTVHDLALDDARNNGPGSLSLPSASFPRSLVALGLNLLGVYRNSSKQGRAGPGA